MQRGGDAIIEAAVTSEGDDSVDFNRDVIIMMEMVVVMIWRRRRRRKIRIADSDVIEVKAWYVQGV